MKESAQIALSYLRSNGPSLGLPVAELAERGAHLHVPAGAVPKDGPSAGITTVLTPARNEPDLDDVRTGSRSNRRPDFARPIMSTSRRTRLAPTWQQYL